MSWGELSSEWGELSSEYGASCLLNVGRVVLGRVFFGASCLGARCLWGELSWSRCGHPLTLSAPAPTVASLCVIKRAGTAWTQCAVLQSKGPLCTFTPVHSINNTQHAYIAVCAISYNNISNGLDIWRMSESPAASILEFWSLQTV